MPKEYFSMSMPVEAKDRLRALAEENHMNMSQMVLQLIWNAKLKNPEMVGQQTFQDLERRQNKN